MNKYPVIILTLLFLVVIASGCVINNNQQNQTKNYTQNGVTFTYNGTWEIANTTAPSALAAVGDPSTVNPTTQYPNTFVIIQKPPVASGTDLQTAYNQNYASFFNNTGNQRVSEGNITVNNVKALENVYTTSSGGVQKEMRVVWISQNNNIYVILCGALPADFNNQQKNFDLVINSFKGQ
ncbi:MAG TPA: PsbP-related protein [Methanobacterium sp.]